MLELVLPAVTGEEWDESKEMFIYTRQQKELKIRFEHSLIAISKWESHWHKSFFTTFSENQQKKVTDEEFFDYIKCMTITPNVGDEVYDRLTTEHIRKITKYLDDPMTATTFSNKNNKGGNNRIVTSELIYYWMAELRIPFSCEKWNIKRLMVLIQIFEAEKAPSKKMSKSSENQKAVTRLLDDSESIRKKVMSATTDSVGKINYDPENQPGITNLINIYMSLAGKSKEEILEEFAESNYPPPPPPVADVVVDEITKIKTRYDELISTKELDEILDDGKEKSSAIAKAKYELMKNKIGLRR